MLRKAKMKCPKCDGARLRESRWLSVEEKKKYPDCHPFRCLDCGHRFLAPDEVAVRRDRAVSVPLAGLAIAAAVAVTLILIRPGHDAAAVKNEAALTVSDPEMTKAAEGGDAGAQYLLGQALLQQPGHTPETSARAMRWLQISAENGNTEAMIILGRLSRTGVGTLQNFGQAAKWLQSAAARGNPEGMLELGRLYRDGIGVDKDAVLAYVWFNRASAARNLDAVRERELISRQLAPEQLSEAQERSSTPDTKDAATESRDKIVQSEAKVAEATEKTPDIGEERPESKEKAQEAAAKPVSGKAKPVDSKKRIPAAKDKK